MQPLLLLLILLQGAYGENRLDASSTLVVDTVKFLKPSDFDVLLNDINEIDLYLIGEMEGAQYLNVSTLQPVFPVEGMVMGMNKRYMVNLLARRKNTQHFRNVIFMVDTGSPYTFISKSTMEAMVGPDLNVPSIIKLEIQGETSMICYLSPPDKHFVDVNLLGMDFLEMKGAHLITDWPKKTFVLHDSNSYKMHFEQKCLKSAPWSNQETRHANHASSCII
jgi:hypothetical protein